MGLRLGDDAPDFSAESNLGTIGLYSYLGSDWGILFSHPGAFTPVCTTEMLEMARLKSAFKERNVKVIGLTTDCKSQIETWISDMQSFGKCEIDFPVVADHDHAVSQLYGMVHPGSSFTYTVRSLFIISPAKEIKLVISYPIAVGRNFLEVLRALDALLLSEEHEVATPCNWKQGEEVLLMPHVSKDVAQEKFTGGIHEVRTYLRYVTQPK